MPRRPMSHHALKARGKLSKNQRRRLKKVIRDQMELYNAGLQVIDLTRAAGRDLELQDLEKQLTQVRSEYTEFNQVNRLLSIATLKRAVLAWDRHVHPRKGKEPSGKPRYKTPERFRTIAIESPQSPVIRFTKVDHPHLCIKGLPSIRLKGHRPIPRDRQPSAAIITLKKREISVRLVYQDEPYPKPIPAKEISNPLGIDLGVAFTMATSNGLLYTSPNEERLSREIREAQKTLSRKISAAIRTGVAASRAKLDSSNDQMRSKRGRPQYEIKWLGPQTSGYLKAHLRLEGLYERRNQLRHDFRHRVTTEIVKQAVANQNDLLVTEALQITNMTRSARGTQSDPGRNVRAKSALNRRILQQGWGYAQGMFDYKAAKAGIRHVQVYPGGTSQTCAQCGIRDPESRISQAGFKCSACGHQANADRNASINIGDRGLLYLKKLLGATPESIRLDRLGRTRAAGRNGGVRLRPRGAHQPGLLGTRPT